VVTDMSRARLSTAEAKDSYRQRTPLGRVGEPEDIADVCLFLASDEGRWVTGQTLIASGGLGL
jgi:3-oxoacyl-[acyl-carrier protein] reductase